MNDTRSTAVINKRNRFFIPLLIFEILVAICCYRGVVRSYNATMLALSYKYGFTSRSLLGTIYQGLNDILPFDMMNYNAVLIFGHIMTMLFFVVVMAFSYYILVHTADDNRHTCEYLLFFFDTFAVATYFAGYNFLRVDIFMIMIAIASAMLICKGRYEWLIIPLSAVGVMFHQGFVFMYFNVALALLLYRAFDKKGGKRYIITAIISFVTVSVLFIWFELLSHGGGTSVYEEVVENAKQLTLKGQYHASLLSHEILGIDLTGSESEWHKMNLVQSSFFVVLFLPYIIILIRFFVGVFKQTHTIRERLKYICVAFASLTMLPDFLLKIDYGRWVMAVIAYYSIVICVLAVLKDEIIIKQLDKMYVTIKKSSWGVLLVVYVIVFIPLCDTDINGFAQHLSAWFNHIFKIYSLK